MNFLQGTANINDVTVQILGNENGYRYKWVSHESKPIDYSTFLPMLIIDYSASMHTSNSAKPATDATKSLCNSLFEKGFKEVIIVYFGKTSYLLPVTKNDYSSKIDETLNGYFTNQHAFNSNGKFAIDSTFPVEGFDNAIGYIKKVNHQKVFIAFMTDGQFTNDFKKYSEKWNRVSKSLSDIGKEVYVSSIGYKDDYLNNIKEMKTSFDKEKIQFVYSSINKSDEILGALLNVFDEFDFMTVPKINLSYGITLSEDDCVYSKNKLFETFDLIDVLKSVSGVSEDWIKRVIEFEISVGIKETEFQDRIVKDPSKENYKKLMMELVPYFADIQKGYFGLKNEYRSLKTRNVGAWKSLTDRIESLSGFFRNIQAFISADLNEKKSFEMATKINSSITSRHLRTIQRRKIANEINKQSQQNVYELVSENPITVKCVVSGSEKVKVLNADINKLNDYYVCTYTTEEWKDLLNTMMCIPLQYVWREGDDWAPSRANIENVNLAAFVSIEGYKEAQTMFGGLEFPEHKKLYGDDKYIHGAHDKCNSVLPIAIEPFFGYKNSLLKEHLGHMIAGSSLAFRNGHILFYVAAIRQCFNQLLDNNTEKMKHITLLLLNTFRVLTEKINTIYNKESAPVNKRDIIYNIAIGNTAPYLFGNSFESVAFVLTASEKQIDGAYQKYMTEKQVKISLDEFKIELWKMILRHMYISNYTPKELWNSHKTWGMKSAKEIETILKVDGPETFQKYLMSQDKLYAAPKPIINDIEKMRCSGLMKTFKLLVSWGDMLNDSVWDTLTDSYLPFELKAHGNMYGNFTNDILDSVQYWSYWECFAYGQKECYPMKTQKEITRVVVNNINSTYGEGLTGVIADVKELMDYNQRKYETRFLPVTLTFTQHDNLNNLFEKVYKKQIGESEFKATVYEILGNYYSMQITQVLNDDNLDVLHNLYEYCGNRQHNIKLKANTRLPYSCPGNTSSPYFLQGFTDVEFSMYYKPLGFGWSTKKYRNWIDDLHPYMAEKMADYDNENSFVQNVLDHINAYQTYEKKPINVYEKEVRYFFNQFKQ